MSEPRNAEEAEAVAREVTRRRSPFGRAADAPHPETTPTTGSAKQ